MNEEETKNLELLQKEYSENLTLQHEINKDMSGRRIETVNQQRDYFKFLVYLVAAIIGSSYFLNISKSHTYYFIGVILLISVIIFIVLYLRETIDIDSVEFRNLQDKYNLALDEGVVLVLKYITEKKYSNIDIENYFKELKDLPRAKEIYDNVKRDKEAMKNREKEILNYSGEFIIFLFLSGIIFIIGSIFSIYFNWVVILFGEIIILFVACSNFAKFISKTFSFFIYHIKKYLK